MPLFEGDAPPATILTVRQEIVKGINFFWAVLSDEQMRKIWPFSLLNGEQMSNKVEVKHQPVANLIPKVLVLVAHDIYTWLSMYIIYAHKCRYSIPRTEPTSALVLWI